MPANPFTTGASVRVDADTSSFNNAIGGATDSLMGFKKQVALAGGALGALAAGGLAAATEQARSFDEAIIELSKRVGKDQANEMREGISEMAEEIPLTREEIAGLADDAARFGIEGEEAILDFTETVAKMGEATTLSTDEAGKSMAKLAELTNTPVSEVENLGSSINSLSNNFATSSQEIVDSMLRSSGALSQLGLQQTEIAGMSAALNEVSASSRRAGTRLRRVAQEMMNPKKVSDIASALGMTTEEFKTMREESPRKAMMQLVTAMNEGGEAADKIRTSFSTASRQALAGFAQNLDGTRQALKLSNKEFKEASSLQREFDREMAKTSSSIQIAKSRLNGIAIEIGNNVLPVFNRLLRKTVIPAIDKFSKWNEEMNGMPATVGLVATAIGGFTVAGAALVSMLGGMSAILGAVGAAFTVLTGPIGLAVAAIAALGFAWKKNLGDIRGKTKTALTWVKNFIKNVVAGIKQFWRQFGNRIIKTTKRAFNIVKTVVGDVLTALWVDLIKPTLKGIQQFWDQHGNKIINATKRAFNKILVLVNKALTKIQKFWAKNGDKIMANVTGFLKTVMKLYKKYIIFVWKQIIKPTLGAIQKFWNKHGDQIISATKNAFTTVKNFISTTLKRIKKFWDQRGKDMLASAVETFKQIKKTIVQTMTFVWETIIKPTLKDIKRLWKEHGKGLVKDTKEAFTTIKNRISKDLKFVWQNVIKPTLKLIRGFWNKHGEQIMSWVKNVFKTIQGIISGVMNTVITIIRTILNLISGDWEEAFNLVKDLTKDLLKGTVNWIKNTGKSLFKTAWETAIGVVKDIITGFIDWVIGNSKIKDLFNDIFDYIIGTGANLVKQGFNVVVERVKSALNWLTGTTGGTLFGNVKDTLRGIYDWVWKTGASLFDDAFGRIVDKITGAFEGVNLSLNWPSPPDWLEEALSNVSGGINDALEWISNQKPDGDGGDEGNDRGKSGEDEDEDEDDDDNGDGEDERPPKPDQKCYNGSWKWDKGQKAWRCTGSTEPPEDDADECSGDSDCPSGEVCDNGTCVEEGKGCFVAGTEIKTPGGEKAIESLSKGDEVLSCDPQTGGITTSIVGERLVHSNGEHNFDEHPLTRLHLAVNGNVKTTEVTANHRYLVSQCANKHNPETAVWKQAGDLQPGDVLRMEDKNVEVLMVGVVEGAEPQTVYNLHMEDGPPTYLADGVVVHNAKDKPGEQSGGGFEVQALQSGGFIEKAGLAMLHSGEQVVPAASVDRGGGLDPGQIEEAVARGMMQAAQNEDLANIEIEFRDTGRYNSVRR